VGAPGGFHGASVPGGGAEGEGELRRCKAQANTKRQTVFGAIQLIRKWVKTARARSVVLTASTT